MTNCYVVLTYVCHELERNERENKNDSAICLYDGLYKNECVCFIRLILFIRFIRLMHLLILKFIKRIEKNHLFISFLFHESWTLRNLVSS